LQRPSDWPEVMQLPADPASQSASSSQTHAEVWHPKPGAQA
jgi:hypothetical protein